METLTVKSETDIFQPAARIVSTQSCAYFNYHPLSTPSSTGPIVFNIPGNDLHYVDMSSIQLHIRAKIQSKGADIADDDAKIVPVNNFLHAMFEQVSVHINETQITPTSTMYPYRSCIATMLGLGGENQKTLGRAAFFIPENNAGSTTSESFNQREAASTKSKTFELVGRPFLDICSQSRYIIPNCDIRLTFYKSSPIFSLQEVVAASKATRGSYNIVIESAKISVKKLTLLPSIVEAHLKILNKGDMATYPMRKIDVRTYALPTGTIQDVNETLLTGLLPDRIIIGLVKSEDMHGVLTTTPFNFKSFGLSNITITVNGDSIYQKSVDVDDAKGFVMESFYNMFSDLTFDPADEGPSITLDRFNHGQMFFVFNLNDIGGGIEFGLQRHGTIKIELKFSAAITHSINVVCYADFQSTLLIDNNKGVILK